MRALQLNKYDEYYDFLRKNPNEFKELVRVLTINLSYFFRNPETFEFLQQNVFPEFKDRSRVIFWSAGCAGGEEPYSLAILAEQAGILSKVQIYGTDIDEEALGRARKGIYNSNALQYLSSELIMRYFESEREQFAIKEYIKSRVTFLHHDLFQLPPFPHCDLIVCRNVLIYLDRKAQRRILVNFNEQLKPTGYLVLGKVELLLGIPEMKLFDAVNRAEHIYRKLGTGT